MISPDDYYDLTDLQKIEDVHFPALKGGKGYQKTSESSTDYNCLSWVLGIDWVNYATDELPGYFWFPGVARVWEMATIRQIVEKHSYIECDSFELEEGYEKIVFYVDDSGSPEHFSRQLPTGKWTSKLGGLWDIEHDELDSIAIPEYGTPKVVFKRRIVGSSDEANAGVHPI